MKIRNRAELTMDIYKRSYDAKNILENKNILKKILSGFCLSEFFAVRKKG